MHSKPFIINNLQCLCLRPPSDCELTQDSDRKNAHNLGDSSPAEGSDISENMPSLVTAEACSEKEELRVIEE
jgi:hypothetical protein